MQREESMAKGIALRAGRAASACAALLCVLACALSLASCGGVTVDEDSPTVSGVSFTAESDMSETSQRIEVRLEFDAQISVSGDPLDDFEVLLNDEPIDEDVIKLEAEANAEAVTLVLSPADEASEGSSSGGSFFAVYAGKISVASAREDGALPSITGVSGSAAVLDEAVTGTLPSGLAIQLVSSRAGSEAEGQTAQASFEVTSPALVRAITWFSPDGGETLVLKHNHEFAGADAEDCAANLAEAINEADLVLDGTAVSATASGSVVTISAAEAVEGQEFDPVIVEGVGVSGGDYDASMGTGEEE